ncbi:MAG: hypothetical protein JSR59_26975 [Proteobacteria bacterium]|nr:hypothetical protein [Pseudomonadota bacterium]
MKTTTRPAPALAMSPAPGHAQPRQLSIAFETPALLGLAAEQRTATVRALAELLLRAAGIQLTEADDGEQ